MATYNVAKYLKEQLDSFMGQTRMPDELVVCDDGSSDETIGILERFEKQVPFSVRIYRNADNIGFTKIITKLIWLCQWDIIFLSDQDDVWVSEKLATVEEAMNSSSSILFVVNLNEITDCALNRTGVTQLGRIRSPGSLGIRDDSPIAGCCSAFCTNLKP